MTRNIPRRSLLLAPLLAAASSQAATVSSSDFFAGDARLSQAVVRYMEAVRGAKATDQQAATARLEKALRELDESFGAARGRSVGPFTGGGNPEKERAAAIHVLRALALHRLGKTAPLRSAALGIKRPAPRFTSKNIAGIPMVLRGDPSRKVVALTFDDGPHEPHTTRVLDVLARHDIRATFFLVGRVVRKYPEIVKRILAEGHEIAHHSYTHPKMTAKTDAQIQDEITKTDAAFREVLPEEPPAKMFRLPYQIGHKSKRVQAALAKRYDYIIDWSVDSKDYSARSVDAILKNTVQASKKNGSIVLFHDRRPHTAAAVDALIPKLRDAGFGFGTVSEVMGTDEAGRRIGLLASGLQELIQRKPREAARKFGNFTLAHPDSPAAPAALFTSYYLATWIGRPKAKKLKLALKKRYPETLFSKFLEAKLPDATEFRSGGRRRLRAERGLPDIRELAPLKTAAAGSGDPFADFEDAPPAIPPAGATGGATTGSPRPAAKPGVLPAPGPRRPPPAPTSPFLARGRPPADIHPAKVLRSMPRTRGLEIFRPAPTPLPRPYFDPQPGLSGRHMVAPGWF